MSDAFGTVPASHQRTDCGIYCTRIGRKGEFERRVIYDRVAALLTWEMASVRIVGFCMHDVKRETTKLLGVSGRSANALCVQEGI